ncbi:MAG: hypothetical protein CFH44_00788 [Proteobacteria bacterium]|jgi:hypothetical protein|nr:MAG: hypothetical protein CFH44_00788 [Pseudomonadota bacterium]|tara:strand:- start:3875 stop:4594 length:720 start_codon:yes stop_codon:yes gene_type:complete
MNKNDNNQSTVAVQASIQDIAKMKIKTDKAWHKKAIALAEKLLRKVTKLPVNITLANENIMLNASAIFWYQDTECKKFVMIKSHFENDNDVVMQFPFVASFTKDSVSSVLEKSIKDLFGRPFSKTLAIDTFASDKISSAPTIIIEDEDNKSQTVLHNMVWVNQITPEQFELIQNHSDQFSIEAVAEHELTESQTHEIHKFLYQSCLRHIHKMKFTDFAQMGDSIEDFMQSHSPQSKTLH